MDALSPRRSSRRSTSTQSETQELADELARGAPAVLRWSSSDRRLRPPPPARTDYLGATIGRYKLLERIGEGGFGIVYMAEQQHPCGGKSR
jgi:hypothetical protein